MPDQTITSVSRESRVFKPSAEFKAQANLGSEVTYKRLYKESVNSPEKFWAKQANELLEWRKPFKKVLNWKVPHAKWFADGTLNVSENCLDRHLGTPLENKAAIIFEGEPGDIQTLTYKQLHREVCKFANGLQSLGMKKGDRAAIYMPMVPEAAIAMLACARIGVIHTVIFGGYSAESIKDRVNDCEAKLVITSDGGWRRGKIIELKATVDAALKKGVKCVEHVIVHQRTSNKVTMKKKRDIWWHDLMADSSSEHKAKAFAAENPLFVLYTSGSTGKPKGVLHTSAGYLLGTTITSKYVFDLKETDIYWCTADIGWITGHSYVVYGPLSNGATVLMYEGAPNHPEPDRFWDIIDRHGVTIFYTAPTAIRAFMRWGDDYVKKYSLKSLRLLGSVGEPINPEAWMWYHRMIGKKRCPIVDTWWQTETGAIMVTPLPGVTPAKPGSCAVPFFGVVPKILDETGQEVPKGEGGRLFLTQAWPSMLRTLWGDDDRFKKQYWSEIKGIYFAGDGARFDEDGYLWVVGRIDDVLNVSGHRIGTAEVESVLVAHPKVAEAAVVGRPDDLKGSALVCFVTLKSDKAASDDLKQALRVHVAKEIGAFARPDSIRFAPALPKTRSGKIMRRILKDIAAGVEVKGDITTLEDIKVVAALQASD
ncbi:MAG: acetate--CoA ligase [Opitutaceae bacterium]|nr:acetate--CoA ligase [Opitutaceae bacterium]